MKIGISGLAAGNSTGLGRLARIFIISLAETCHEDELHVYFRSPADLELITAECDRRSKSLCESIIPHFPPVAGLNRLLLEDWDLPRQFGPLQLDSYLGCDFTLPPRPVARREAAVIPDLLPITKPLTVSWRARWLYRRGINRSISRNADLICISNATREILNMHFPQVGRSRVVYPAVSPILWNYCHSDVVDHALQVRGSLASLRKPGRYLLSVGVSGIRKNTKLLVQLFGQLVRGGHYKGSLILVGGDGRYHTAPRPDKRLAAETIGNRVDNSLSSAEIHDIGRVSDYDLSQLYSNADLLVSLSQEEGFGFPVLEALVHGTPAFVTEGTAMQEIAESGIISTPLNMAQCLERLKSALGAIELLRREVRQLDLSRFSTGRLGKDLKEILKADVDA